MKKIMFWVPRIIMILFILMISMLALDAFEGDQSIYKKIIEFVIHLIPTLILIVVLIVSWRREWIGGIFFILLGILYIAWAWGKFDLSVYFLISGTLFFAGILFWINWIQKKKTKQE